jgi:hypothetical protein
MIRVLASLVRLTTRMGCSVGANRHPAFRSRRKQVSPRPGLTVILAAVPLLGFSFAAADEPRPKASIHDANFGNYRVTQDHMIGIDRFITDAGDSAPAAHDDAFAVYQWALKQRYASGKVALYGDSTGGNLALATAVRAKAAGLPPPGVLTLASTKEHGRGFN